MRDLWQELCSYDNLFLAYKKARKHKTTRDYVIEFEKNISDNLLLLRSELLLHSYRPRPLVSFIIRDPKTRKISKSDFRDRVVHHALCNIIEPIFEKFFIYDSYANRIGKGTLKALQRLDCFKRAASRNNTISCYVLKADIKKYFDHVDHLLLIRAIRRRIKDKRVLWLIKKILNNHVAIPPNKGMPLGNLTSQFFANIYLNELDQFVKHILKARHYIRYVDDFVILHPEKKILSEYKEKISIYLQKNLHLDLHPGKSKILLFDEGLSFLGLRVFYFHKLLKKQNVRKFQAKLTDVQQEFYNDAVNYDTIYDLLEGWIAYAKQANSYQLRLGITSPFEDEFSDCISTKEINRITKWQSLQS